MKNFNGIIHSTVNPHYNGIHYNGIFGIQRFFTPNQLKCSILLLDITATSGSGTGRVIRETNVYI